MKTTITQKPLGLTIIGTIVGIIVFAGLLWCVYKHFTIIADRVDEIGHRREYDITNALAESAVSFPWSLNEQTGEYYYVIPDEEIDPFLARLTVVSIQSSAVLDSNIDSTNWSFRMAAKSDPEHWIELAKPIMLRDMVWSNMPIQFYRAVMVGGQ